MPAYVLALYGTPDDPAAFDAHYEAIHVPLGRPMPGLRGGGISAGPALAPDGSVAFHQVAVLEFDSLADAQRALASPQGQATAADAANFITGGVTVAMF
ncbi:MAG TPA: EthD family reductase, partial [Thermomicrobiales bacterium]|nr:EthD family reductase [Thermomicrobiales bacterium]